MKTLLLTGYDNNMKEIGDITSEIMSHYATRHGIDFLRVRQYASNLHPSWQKTDHVAKMLEVGYDRVLWLDADTVITNTSVSPLSRDWAHPLDVSQDWGTDATEVQHFSMGNFVANKDSHAFYRLFWHQLPSYVVRWGLTPLWEQGACQEWYVDTKKAVDNRDPSAILHPAHIFKVHPRRTFNAVHASLAPSAPEPWQPGDWLCHLTGEEITNEKRMVVLKELLTQIEE